MATRYQRLIENSFGAVGLRRCKLLPSGLRISRVGKGLVVWALREGAYSLGVKVWDWSLEEQVVSKKLDLAI